MNELADLARGVIVAGIPAAHLDSELPRFAGYVLFERNGNAVSRLRSLTDALRSRFDPYPLIAIDQEGGRVVRLREGAEPMPSMMALGALGDPALAQRAGEQVAFDLRRAGCTLDFAPALDLAIDPGNTVIGTRSFGSDPKQVAALGLAFGRGLEHGGIFPCYKHFPGHGATDVDSHAALPVVDAAEATLHARDLIPFAAAARGAPAMMTGHILVNALDAAKPATCSYAIATTLLRDGLGFGGALFTDCLEMKAVAHDGSSDRAVEALAAGADVLLFSHDLERAAEAAVAIEAAVSDGRITLERLREAHARVSQLRAGGADPLPIDAFAPHPGIGRQIARRAVTVVRGVPHADPVASIAVSFGGECSRLRHEAPALAELVVSIDPNDAEVASALRDLQVRQRRPILLARRAHLHPAQARAIATIAARYSDVMVVSLLEPFDVPLFPQARHLLATYGDDLASIGGLADVIFGGTMPEGRMPVNLAGA